MQLNDNTMLHLYEIPDYTAAAKDPVLVVMRPATLDYRPCLQTSHLPRYSPMQAAQLLGNKIRTCPGPHHKLEEVLQMLTRQEMAGNWKLSRQLLHLTSDHKQETANTCTRLYVGTWICMHLPPTPALAHLIFISRRKLYGGYNNKPSSSAASLELCGAFLFSAVHLDKLIGSKMVH